MFGPRRSRFDRRSQARARRVQRRLEQVQRNRGTRGAPRSLGGQLQSQPAPRSRAGQLGIFVASVLFGTLLASTVTATVLQWWNEKPATLESIAVQGTERLTSGDVAWATGLARGSRLEDLSAADLERTVAAHPWIREARVVVLPTGTVIVDVVERVPRAVLRDESGLHFVDEGGIAFAVVSPEEATGAAALPLLAGNGSDVIALQESLAIADHAEGLALPGFARHAAPHRGLALQVRGTGDARRGWVLHAAEGPEVILGSGDVALVTDRLDRLERLLQAELDELEETTAIDLRFAGQAVLRRNGTSR